MTGTILRCNTRIELTVTEFLRLDRMRGAERAAPARLHCELEQRHDGDHVAFAQNGEGTMTDSAEWWIRWNASRRDIAEMPWCLAKDPGQVRFGGAEFSGGMVDFSGARRWSHPPTFSWDGKPPTGVVLPVEPSEETKGEL